MAKRQPTGQRRNARHRRPSRKALDYELWPETADLLASRVARSPATLDRWALLTKDGQRIVRYNAQGGRCDPILMSWKSCWIRRGCPPSGGSRSSTCARRSPTSCGCSDEPTQQLMLVHCRRSLAAKHYTGAADFTRLDRTLRRARSEMLHEMFATRGRRRRLI